jgi:phage shock protein A
MFQRIGNLIRGFFGLFISGQGLAAHAGLCERLMSQVKKLETDERDLRAKTGAHLKAGNRDTAAQYALRLQTVTRELAENRTQLEQAETTYRELTKARDVSIRAAQEKIGSLKASLDDLKIKRATAELNEMAAGLISNIGGSGDTLNRLHEMVEDERTRAAGRARVARDSLAFNDIHLKEAEQTALADQALADFAAREGLVLDAAPAADAATAAAPAKTMGPQTQ